MADHRTSKSTGHASEFYMACRQGDLLTVNRYLKTMTTREINRVEESNGSTALHAASFFGHADVVKRLLEVGASIHTHNGYGKTPEQEASTQEIKDLFKGYH
jgi:ankyrin repeat protein